MHVVNLDLERSGHPGFQGTELQLDMSQPQTQDYFRDQIGQVRHFLLAWNRQLQQCSIECPRVRALGRRELVCAMRLLPTLKTNRSPEAILSVSQQLWPYVALCFPEQLLPVREGAPLGLRELDPADSVPAEAHPAVRLDVNTISVFVRSAYLESGLVHHQDDGHALLLGIASILHCAREHFGVADDVEPQDEWVPLSSVSRLVAVPGSTSTLVYGHMHTLMGVGERPRILPWQVLKCSPHTREDDLEDFLRRRSVFSTLPLFVEGANRLVAASREHLQKLLLTTTVPQGDDEAAIVYIIFPEASGMEIFGFLTEDRTMMYQLDSLRQWHTMLPLAQVAKFVCVVGPECHGKSTYIRQELQKLSHQLVFSVNEDFAATQVLNQLRVIFAAVEADGHFDVGLHINISPHVIGSHLEESAGPEAARAHETPLHRLASLLEQLVMLGVAGDPDSGELVRSPRCMVLHIFCELPSVEQDFRVDMLPLVPMIDLFGAQHMVDVSDPAVLPFILDANACCVAWCLQRFRDGTLGETAAWPENYVEAIGEDECRQEIAELIRSHQDILGNRLLEKRFVDLMATRCADLVTYHKFVTEMRAIIEVDGYVMDRRQYEGVCLRLFPFFLEECVHLCDRTIGGDISLHRRVFTVRHKDQAPELMMFGFTEDEAAQSNNNLSYCFTFKGDTLVFLHLLDLLFIFPCPSPSLS
jgi:hypothetical protein